MVFTQKRMTKLKRFLSEMATLMMVLTVLLALKPVAILASEEAEVDRTLVKVAFFPMDGYNVTLSDGTLTGMDVEYLTELCNYLQWDIQYVSCDSWEEALAMLENHEVDLVGSAQYSEERARKFIYAELSSGYTFGTIAVEGDNKIAFEDFAVMKDLSYGVVADYVRKAEFYSYLAEHDISKPVVKEYKNTKELMEALDKGEVEAIVHTFTEIKAEQRIIGEFSPKPFYYISYRGNDSLMTELNQGIAELKLAKPDYESKLISQFYEGNQTREAALSTVEKEYIKNNPILKVGYFTDYYPYSYEEDGDFKGICRTMLEDLAENTGFEIQYVKIQDSKTASAALSAGKIDLLCFCTLTEEIISAKGFYLTEAYTSIPMVLVKHQDTEFSEIKTIAIVNNLFKEASLAFNTTGIELKEYGTQIECLQAVAKGQVDATLCDGYLSEYLIKSNDAFRKLTVESVVNVDHEIAMVAPKDKDREYYAIISKMIGEVSDKQVSEYIIETSSHSVMSLRAFVEEHAVSIIFILVILLFIGATVSIHIRRDNIKINRLMYRDFGMDVWNLNYLTYHAMQNISFSGRNHYAVVSLNLTQFRLYNRLYGKNAGQKLLEEIVEQLDKYVEKPVEIFARDHGDRFILFIEYYDEDDFLDRLEDIKSGIENNILEATNNSMTVVMGVGFITRDNPDIENAISNANLAMEAAKGDDDDGIMIFDSVLENSLKEEHEREQLLKSVDINKDFVAFYQAKVDIRTNKVVGAEALVRFKDPTADGTIRAPYFFVPYYEKTGKIMEIDFFVLESVCKLLRERIDQNKNVVPISVNFSRHHFMSREFADKYEEVTNRYSIPKELIEVEITETLVVGEMQQQIIKETIDELKSRDIRLSIDDFGSGYSSLGVFEQIPASVIKLDRSFLLNQQDRDRQIAIMKGIVKMAADLDAQVVCEGVENDQDVEIMNEIGAYIAQGYKYSKPIPVEDFEVIIDRLTI